MHEDSLIVQLPHFPTLTEQKTQSGQWRVHTSVTELMWQYANSCFCREQSSWWRWAGWLLSDDDMPCCSLSLFFSSSPNAWSCITHTQTSGMNKYRFTGHRHEINLQSWFVNPNIYEIWNGSKCFIAKGNWLHSLYVVFHLNLSLKLLLLFWVAQNWEHWVACPAPSF